MQRNTIAKEPLLSIGIITFNRSEYLNKMLDSIPRDNPEVMSRIEILVLNNGSTDDTDVVLQKYRNQMNIKYIEQKVNKRGAETFQRIIDNASGKFMIIPGDDDCFYGNEFLQLLERLETLEKDVNLLTCFADVIDDKGRLLSSNYRPNSNDTQEKTLAKLIFDSIFWLPSTIFRREILANVRLSPSIIALDWSFWIEAITTGRSVVLPVPLVKYRQHSNREQESYLKQTWNLDSFLMLENSITSGSFGKWFDESDKSSLDLFIKEFEIQSKNRVFNDLDIAIYLLVCRALHKKTDIRSLVLNLYKTSSIRIDPRFIQTLFGISLTLSEIEVILTSMGVNFDSSGINLRNNNKINYFGISDHDGTYSYVWKVGAQSKHKNGVLFSEIVDECLQVYKLLQSSARKLEIESTISPNEKRILNFVRKIRKLKYQRRKLQFKPKWMQ